MKATRIIDIPLNTTRQTTDALGQRIEAGSSKDETSCFLLIEAAVRDGEFSDLGGHQPFVGVVSESEENKLFVSEVEALSGLTLLNDALDACSDGHLGRLLCKSADRVLDLSASDGQTGSGHGTAR